MKTKQRSRLLFTLIITIVFVMAIITAFSLFASGKAGDSVAEPVVCYSFAEFKAAMEDPSIKYVALANVYETLPAIEGNGTGAAITVKTDKNLQLWGVAEFVASVNRDGYYRYDNLIHVTNAGSLSISGGGILIYNGNLPDGRNAVVYNQGTLNVFSGTLKGSYITKVYGMAIWHAYGELNIYGGKFYGEIEMIVDGATPANYAVNIVGGKANINGGYFYANYYNSPKGAPYGIKINKNADVKISGGIFIGLLLDSAKHMSDYVDPECVLTYNGNKVDPKNYSSIPGVAHAEVYKEISNVDIYVNTPTNGDSIEIKAYGLPEDTYLHTINWFENGTAIGAGKNFKAGKSYVAKIYLFAEGNAQFASSLTKGSVNGKTVAVTHTGKEKTSIELIVDFGVCANTISLVELTVTAPKEGNVPSYSVTVGDSLAYHAPTGNKTSDYRKWYESSDGYDWWEINTSSKFKSGYYYKFVVDVEAKTNYSFPLDSNLDPAPSAKVNGFKAKAGRVYDQDPSRYIKVEYNFGECNDNVVESISITNIDAPAAGQTPDYMASCFGTGYSMAGTNSGNWKVNGIVWLRDGNIYTGSIMDNTEKFQAGHKYTVMIDLVADSGYTFQFNNSSGVYAKTSINGNTAQIAIDHCSTTKYQVWYTFTCEAQEISTVMLYDLEKPVGGNKPDTSVTPAYPEYYVVESVKWFDIEDNPAGSVFEAGVPYYALITVAPANSGVKFADAENMTAYIDGNILPGVEVKNNKVIVPVIIRKPASAPIVDPYVFLTQPEGGELTVGEAHNSNWETSFIPTMTEIQYWDGKSWDQWDVQYPQHGLDDYDFESVDAGSYRFRIVAYVGNQIAATSNEFVITWEKASANKYLVVCTPGDGQGSGYFEDDVAEGTQHTLESPDKLGMIAIEGFTFDYWSIRKGTAMGAEVAKMQPGDKIVIDDNTYIIAMWKEAPLSEYIYVYGAGEGQGSGDYDYVTSGTVITLQTPENMGIYPIDGFKFDYWSIRIGNAQASESARKHVGDTVIINDNTYIIAMWKEAPLSTYTVVYSVGEGQGSGIFEDGVVNGTIYILDSYETIGAIAPEGMVFDYWSIRVGSAQSAEIAKKQPGDTIIINDNTYIIAMWKDLPSYIVSYDANGGSGTMVGDMVQANGTFTLEECTYIAPAGKRFKAWAIGGKYGQQKQPGDKITITSETYIYAVWEDIPHTCVGILQSGKQATCTSSGWKDYYKCDCGKYYEDANCTVNIADIELWKAGNGKTTAQHSFGSWKSDADKHWKECTCGEKSELANHSGGAASCKAKAKCAVCGAEYGALAEHKYSAATCTAKAKCSSCGAETGELAAHKDSDSDGKCDACKYQMSVETESDTTPETTEATPPETTEATPPETTEVTPPETTESTPPETTQSTPPESTKDPEPDTTTAVVQDTEPDATNTPDTQPEKEKGCGGVIDASAIVLMAIVSLAGVWISKKRR